METVKITKIYRSMKDKNGNPLKTKDGRPYERVAIKTTQYGDKYISGFGGKGNLEWKEGDEVQIEISENGEYLNFDMPKASSASPELLVKINQILENTITIINKLEEAGGPPSGLFGVVEPVKDEGVPF